MVLTSLRSLRITAELEGLTWLLQNDAAVTELTIFLSISERRSSCLIEILNVCLPYHILDCLPYHTRFETSFMWNMQKIQQLLKCLLAEINSCFSGPEVSCFEMVLTFFTDYSIILEGNTWLLQDDETAAELTIFPYISEIQLFGSPPGKVDWQY